MLVGLGQPPPLNRRPSVGQSAVEQNSSPGRVQGVRSWTIGSRQFLQLIFCAAASRGRAPVLGKRTFGAGAGQGWVADGWSGEGV